MVSKTTPRVEGEAFQKPRAPPSAAAKPMAGAIVAALFMRRFLAPGTPWIHFDLYAWNDSSRPGRPEGGEAQAMRAVCAAIEAKLPAAG